MTESLSDAQIQYHLIVSRHLVFAPFSILIYDYALTFEQEVTRYWGTSLTWGTLLFYINRYSALLGTVPIVVEYLLVTDDSNKICRGLQMYHQYFALMSQILVSVMLITRTYALHERNKLVLALMITVTVVAIINAMVLLLAIRSPNTLSPVLRSLGCPSASPHALSQRQAGGWSGMLVFDVMIFALTVYKSLKYGTRGGELFDLLFRDGAMYFGILIASNVINILTYTRGGPVLSGAATSFTNILSSVMLSRLMLNLRDPSLRHRQALRTRTTSRLSTTQDSAAITTMQPYSGSDIALDTVYYDSEHSGEGEGHVRWRTDAPICSD
ncbi:hypothetical protein B0H15DRAFT_825705 [Mycena belliarum]|uniref:DUF6533 domain-containing protein n=1 Tax=Mycena belliarum TaxID=1033014 RepID=A0AAD6UF85_9AGAR|nr:hypothetical protein B0H15DRAFT_825705 [Mycena belliae]